MQTTAIAWTNLSCNPLKYRRKSDGKVVRLFNATNMEELEPFLDEKELRRMLTYKPASGKRVFCADMTDAFGEWVPDALLDRLFAVFALRPDVTFQVLTKRAERMADYLAPGCGGCGPISHIRQFAGEKAAQDFYSGPWPLPNVHCGVSVEDQPSADKRIGHLLRTPATVRFLSVEPMLGPIAPTYWYTTHNWHNWLTGETGIGRTTDNLRSHEQTGQKVDWVICGGESGRPFRPMDLAWLRALRDQCRAAGVPFFMKQNSSLHPGDFDSLPDDLKIQEFPAA